MPPKAKAKPKGMTREEAEQRIKDLEDANYVGHVETYVIAVKAMRSFPTDHVMQAKGCWGLALGAVTHARFILHAGGAEAIVAAMSAFPQDDRLVAEGCETLRLLSAKKDGQKIVVAAGGIAVACIAAAMHPESGRVQQEAAGALTKMAASDPEAVLGKGGMENIMRVMEMFPRYSWVQVWGCQAMKSFALLDTRRVEGVSGFDRIQETMQSHKDVEAVQIFGHETMMLKPVP